MEDNYDHEMPPFLPSTQSHSPSTSPRIPSAQNPVTSSLGNNGAWAFRRLPLVHRFLGEFILCLAMGLVTSLNGMDHQLENLGLPGTWVLLFFGLMGLCCVITGGCIITLHWRKKLRWERCAQHWVEVIRASSFTYSPHLYWVNTQRHYGIHAAINRGPSIDVTNSEIKVQIVDCLWDTDTLEARCYGPRGSRSRAETPVALEAALVVSRQPQCNQNPQR